MGAFCIGYLKAKTALHYILYVKHQKPQVFPSGEDMPLRADNTHKPNLRNLCKHKTLKSGPLGVLPLR